MDFFTFIVVVVAIVSGTEMVGRIFGPGRRRSRRLEEGGGGSERGGPPPGPSPAAEGELVVDLARRLERIEERLDFLEELRAPAPRGALPGDAPREDPAARSG